MSEARGIGAGLPPWPEIDFSEFGQTETRPLSRIQKITAGFMHRNWLSIPHVTHHDDIDITGLERHRKSLNDAAEVKVSALAFQVKAVVCALREYPHFNASLDADGSNLILKSYFNIGIAVDTPSGLLVPVIRDCDSKSVSELAQEISAISSKARENGLTLQEMSGGCFTISSLGGIGGTGFTPIINAPEVAILGVSRARWTPVRVGDASEWRLMLPVSLSYDHRVINGADAARLTRHLEQAMSEPEQL